MFSPLVRRSNGLMALLCVRHATSPFDSQISETAEGLFF